MIPVRGYAARSATLPLRPFDFERRNLRPKDVLIDILSCGICHSDLHLVATIGELDLPDGARP